MGIAMGWQGTWAVAAAFGGEVQFTPQTSEDDPIQKLFARAAAEQQPKPIRKLSELPADAPARLAIEKWERKGGYQTEHTAKRNTIRKGGGRPKGQIWTPTELKVRERIIADWRCGTKYAEAFISTQHKNGKIQSGDLYNYQKKTLKWYFEERGKEFGWSKAPTTKQIRELLANDKL